MGALVLLVAVYLAFLLSIITVRAVVASIPGCACEFPTSIFHRFSYFGARVANAPFLQHPHLLWIMDQ
jgi:hypothetical protein